MTNPTHSLTFENLRAQLTAEIANNGGPGQCIGYQFGAIWPDSTLYPREPIARVLEDEGLTAAAKVARDIEPAKALAESVRARAATLCSEASRAESSQHSVDTVLFRVEALDVDTANAHLRAWSISRGVRPPAERSPVWQPTGARVFVSPSGIFAAPPKDGPEDMVCAAIARELVRHAHVLLATMDNTLASRTLDAAYREAGAFPHLCRGLKMGLRSGRTDKLVSACLRLRAECSLPVAVEPRFRGGISETYISESLVRDLQGSVEEITAELVKDASRTMQPAMLARRRALLQERIDVVRNWRNLLAGWDGDLEAKLVRARDAYAAAVTGVTMTLPEWALDAAAATLPEGGLPAAEPSDAERLAKVRLIVPSAAPSGPTVADAPAAPHSDHDAFAL
jgi:hypothetical protein